MGDFPHETFEVGDRVINAERPKWGTGEVIRANPIGELPTPEGTLVFHRNSTGQHLAIRFEDGRTRTLASTSHQFKKVKG